MAAPIVKTDHGQNAWSPGGLLYEQQNAILAASGGTPAAPTPGTPSTSRVTNAGTIATGAISFSIANVGANDGVADGDPLKPNEVLDYPPIQGNTYGAFTYDATGTEFLIIETR